MYDPATDLWSTAAPLPAGESELSAGVFSGNIVAVDGYTLNGDTGANAALNVAKNSWSSLPSDSNPRNGACTGVISGNLYVADGDTDSTNTISVMEAFNPAKKTWTTLTAMPLAVTDISNVVLNNQLYCIGGGSNSIPFSGSAYNTLQIYTP